jgi:hypothetical protein
MRIQVSAKGLGQSAGSLPYVPSITEIITRAIAAILMIFISAWLSSLLNVAIIVDAP